MKRCATEKRSVSGMLVASSGRTPNDGGPCHQLLSPSSVRTSPTVGPAAYRSAGLRFEAPGADRAHETSARLDNATRDNRRGAVEPRTGSSLHLRRPRRPGADSPHGILRFRGDPEMGAEACVEGPVAASSRIKRCAPPCATLSLAPAADAAKYAADLGCGTLAGACEPT